MTKPSLEPWIARCGAALLPAALLVCFGPGCGSRSSHQDDADGGMDNDGYQEIDGQTQATCFDGIQNQGELGIDCEGPCPMPCNLPSTGIFVALDGDDVQGDGSIDHPYRTLERGRQHIRDLKNGGAFPEDGAVVFMRAGVYELDAPFILSSEDSGTESAPIFYMAYAGEEVYVIGGIRLDPADFTPVDQQDPNWGRINQAAASSIVRIDLSAYTTDYGSFMPNFDELVQGPDLFFNERRLDLARWPNRYSSGGVAAHILDPSVAVREADCGEQQGSPDCNPNIDWFGYEEPNPATWQRPEEVWLYGRFFYDWHRWSYHVQSIDTANRIFHLHPDSPLASEPGTWDYYGIREGYNYFAYNILEELDAPGEWYLDRSDGSLYLYPPASDISAAEIFFSVMEEAVWRFEEAAHVTVFGINIGMSREKVVSIEGGRHVTLIGTRVFGAGTTAITMTGSENGMEHGVVHGVYEGIRFDGTPEVRNDLLTQSNYVRHTELHDCWEGAILLDQYSVGVQIANNEFHDNPSWTINVNGSGHLIELNEFHHVGTDIADAGVIYQGWHWSKRGSVIRHNYFHDISSSIRHGYIFMGGVYLDGVGSGMTVYGNIFYNLPMGFGVFHSGGRDNLITNNIFVGCDEAYVYLNLIEGIYNGDHWMHGHVVCDLFYLDYQSPPWSSTYPELAVIPKPDCCIWNTGCPDGIIDDTPWMENHYDRPGGSALFNNVFWNNGRDLSPHIYVSGYEDAMRYVASEPGCTSTDCGMSCYQDPNDEWHATCDPGQNLVGIDPGFVDEANRDLNLRPDSPAMSQLPGFTEIPFDQIGR